MEMIILNVEEIFFRDMYRKICLLTGASVVDAVNLRDLFDFPPDEKFDGFLTYAYIDKDAGFTFEILAAAQLVGERVKTFPVSYKKSVKLKRGQVDDAELKILDGEYSVAFRDKIYVINDAHSSDELKEQTRFIKSLDAFRHPDYPDDVVVYFFGENHQPELLWARCRSIDENILTGELLNEPHKNFGCHAGDLIKFGLAQIGEQNILLYLPTK